AMSTTSGSHRNARVPPTTAREAPGTSSAGRTGRCSGSGGRQDVDQPATLARPELDLAGCHREQGVVAAAAHVLAGVEVGAPLAHDDGPGLHGGAVVHLHAQPLGRRVTAVPGGAAAFG